MKTHPNSLIRAFRLLVLLVCSGGALFGALPGAYSPAELDKQEVKAAADFAVQEQAKRDKSPLQLRSIATAEQQVVAGMNYRLTLVVSRGGNSRSVKATIFRALDSHYEMKSWEWLEK